MRSLYIILVITLLSSQLHANELTGYFQSDFTTSQDPDQPRDFQLRRINIIYTKKVMDNAKVLVDIEYENGLELAADGGPGEVKISRGYGELKLNSRTKLQIGKFLTPFGIYNEIHDFSASYVPIDPPIFFRKNQFFTGDSSRRAISKYSTGLLLHLKYHKLSIQTGLANGEQLEEDGSDKNRSPLTFMHLTYNFWRQSSLGLSYQKDKINVLNGTKWEESYGLDLQIESQTLLFQAEFFRGKKWNRTVEAQNTTYQSASFLAGHYLSESTIIFARYGVLTPNVETTEYKTEEYGIGVNYYFNYYTILKWESYQELHNTLWIADEKYLTHKLSLAIVF